jgi:DNA-binding MarR family transcriptional regulator
MENNNDFVKELGYLGFTMRLKRISDAMMHEGRRLYSDLDFDIEPNWYVIFKLLKSRGPMCVTDIADSIRMAHPSVITITNKMLNAGYLISERDPSDSRKRVLDLSARSVKQLPEYEKIWDAGEKGVEQALGELNALEFISTLEDLFFNKGFKERTLEQLNNKTS